MNTELRKLINTLDGHHEIAGVGYRGIIEKAIKESGSIAAAARKAGLPPSNIHEALKRGSYLAIRNCAHAIARGKGRRTEQGLVS